MLTLIAILTLILVPMTASAQAQPYVHDSRFPFIIITKDTTKTLPPISDEEFYDTSSGVIFKVNSTEILSDDPFIKLYRDSVLSYINEGHYQLRKVFIRGAASPEGPYANNQRLGCDRSSALLGELRKGLFNQYIETDADISCITEDYGYLCLLMKEANDPDYNLVKSIYDECEGDEPCCKKNLQAAKRGTLWARLLKEYFPRLRSARFILWLSEPDEIHAPVKVMPLDTVKTEVIKADTDTVPAVPEVLPLKYYRRHLIAARTNLVHDFFYMPGFGWANSPNIQFEYYPLDGHYTYNIDMTWGTNRKWGKQKFWQVRDFQFELRRYFKGGGKFIGTYLGAYLNGSKYGIGLGKDKGWQGEGGGLGLTLGHTMALNKKGSLRLELMAAAGFFLTTYDPYVYGNPVTGTLNGKYYYDYLGKASDFKKRNHTFTWLGPTNLGIQITYDIVYRKKRLIQQ